MSYVSRESGKLVTPFNDAKTLDKTLSKITGHRYEVVEAKPDFPPPSDNAKWYLIAQGEIPKVYHAQTIWIDRDGGIRTESMYLGNTTEWIEQDYGEEGAATATNPGGSDLQSVRKYLAKQFPLVNERLEAYQKILDDTSSKYGISLNLTCRGGKFVATLFMGVTIDVKDLDEEQMAERIKRNPAGLREAWNRIGDYETEWQKRRR